MSRWSRAGGTLRERTREFQEPALYDARQKQLRDNPSNRDIETGDALNVAVADLSDPRLGSSALRAAKVTVPASLIATVPFVYASERVTLMLDDLRTSVKWPEVFDDERFAKDQETFDDLRSRIRQAADAGDVSAKILREAKGFVQDLRAKVEAQPLKDPDHQKEALRFLTACTSLLGLLEKPNIGPALLELRKIQDTMVGNLLGFMHAYNLRFGAAKTPTERQAFHQLFAILDQTRDQILAEARLDSSTARANPRDAEGLLPEPGPGTFEGGGGPAGSSAPEPVMNFLMRWPTASVARGSHNGVSAMKSNTAFLSVLALSVTLGLGVAQDRTAREPAPVPLGGAQATASQERESDVRAITDLLASFVKTYN